QKYWDKWTADSDGKLNIKEIGALLRNPDIKGEEAAVLGTLAITLTHDVINKEHKPMATFTEADVLSNSKDSDAVKYFKDAMEQLHGDTDSKGLSLFGKTGHPDWKEVKQWKVGDCWFVSVVDAVLRKYGADYVEKMITQDPKDPNKFTVKFPGYDKPIKVTLTEGEISMFSHTMNDGSWLAVLGMALNDVIQSDKKTDGYRSWYPFGHVVNGGNNLTTYKLFTNKTYTRISTKNLSELKAALKWAEDHHDPIGINTHVHDLSIKRIDWQTGQVEIQNPWGTKQIYTTDIKIKMGPDGTFWIPLDELYKDSFIKVEVPVEAKNDTERQNDSDSSGAKVSTGESSNKPSSSSSSAAPENANSLPDQNAAKAAEGSLSHQIGDIASLAVKDISVERQRFNEELKNLLDLGSDSAKAIIPALQNAVNSCRNLEDKLIESLSSSLSKDEESLTKLRASVQQSRTSADKELAKLDQKYSPEIAAAMADERRLIDHEIEMLTKMSQNFSLTSKIIPLNQGSALVANKNALCLRSANATINTAA
ncbi:MAG: hypothetical protein K2X81_03095, partial [Candidatus Obscuribacterales bacterium]|nr:hypothetical protein [Candidatus Obscuribacterales bacterium]